MRYLLDTCTAIWFFEGNEQIKPNLQFDLTNPQHDLFLSDISLLEIVIKHQLGKFPLPSPPSKILIPLAQKHMIEILPLSSAAIFQLEKLPLHHRDPFDRLLIAQAQNYKMTLVTPDPLIHKYDVSVRWN